MREAYVTINDIPTHVLTWGKWIEESFDENEKEVVIFLTGNPGLPGFYTNFLSIVHENIGRNIPVWTLSHGGHDLPPPSAVRKIPVWHKDENKINLSGQVASKIEFIKRHVPKDVKIHLIGHSIGSWMILELLKDPIIKNKIKQGYLIFPTIERMAQAPEAKKLFKLFIPFLVIFKFLFCLLSKFPIFIQTMILYIYFYFNDLPIHALGTGLKFINPIAFENCIKLAEEEMKCVTDLDRNTIEENKTILRFYYGSQDEWVPVNYYYELKEKISNVNAEIDSNGIPHNFMAKARYENILADKISKWIKECN